MQPLQNGGLLLQKVPGDFAGKNSVVLLIFIIYLTLLLDVLMTYFMYAHFHFLQMIFLTDSYSYFNDLLLRIILTITHVGYDVLLSIFLTVPWNRAFSYFVSHRHLIFTLPIPQSFVLSRLPDPSDRNHPLT